ncbi:MAG: 3-phosphoshikimate 1-carboxyvinyltransferase, partial [Acidimicrobiales bacterium]
ALLCAGLCDGTTVLRNALAADDTDAMARCLRAAGVEVIWDGADLVVTGRGTLDADGGATLDAGLSGTTSRFLLAVLAASPGRWTLDGDAPLRRRPFGGLLRAVRALGGDVREEGDPECLPLAIAGATLPGGAVEVPGDVTSQFVSALLLAGPRFTGGINVAATGEVVSWPFVAMTREVMAEFGVEVHGLTVPPSVYRSPGTYVVEPDASSASYFFAAAAITDGRVTVEGLGASTLQGDLQLVGVLEQMGCTVTQTDLATTVEGPPDGGLRGVDVHLASLPDMAQTVAAVSVFATGPTRVRGVGIIRGHETDRIQAVVTELRRLGVEAHEHADGFTVVPGQPQPGVVETYDDHRMAMAFAVIGLRASGIAIADPGCVAKTFPAFFAVLDELRFP